jgi:tetratricopeptide (TPR) repeat protein
MRKDPEERYQSVVDFIKDVKIMMDNRRKGSRRPGAGAGSQRRAISIPIAALVVIIAAFLAYDLFVSNPVESDVKIPIAVIDFDNETDEPALDGLSGMLITALEQSRRLSVMTRSRMFDVLTVMGRDDVDRIDESLGQELCQQAGVGALAIPTIHRFGDKYTIDLKVLDTRRNVYIFTTKEEGEGQESIPGMIDEIAKNIRIDLQEESEAVEENTQNVADVTTVSLEAYKHYFEGDRLVNELEFGKAVKELEKAIELDSTFALAHYRLAYAQWWSQHELEAAELHVHRAMELIDRIPHKEQMLVKALNASLEDGFAAQMPYLREMQEGYPEDKEMLFGIGDIAFHTNDYDTAQVYFEIVLELDPKFERALQHLTWTYLRTEQWEPGYDMAQRWVALANSFEAHQYLAVAAAQMGNFEEAIGHYETARAHTESKAYATRGLAGLYLIMGQPDKALGELWTIVNGDYDDKQVFMAFGDLAGKVLPYLGRYSEAIQMIDVGIDSLHARGDSVRILTSILGKAGLVYWGWGDADRMWEIIETTYEYPDEVKEADYWMSVAAMQIIEGDMAEGLRLLDEYNKQPMAVPFYRSIEYAAKDQCELAAATLDSIPAPQEANKTGVRYAVAECFFENGDYKSAAGHLETITNIRFFSLDNGAAIAKSYYLLARCYEELGDVAHATSTYQRFLDIWQNGDEDLADLIDAKARVAALQAAGSM